MKTQILFMVLAICLIAIPAKADLFNITVHNLESTFGGTTFTADWYDDLADLLDSNLNLTRWVSPTGTATITDDSADYFTITMSITNIVGNTADGTGTFTVTDIDGDTITGDVDGYWTDLGSSNAFTGTLSNVYYTGDNFFDGDTGSVSMIFATDPQPWNGSIVELTATAPWFDEDWVESAKGGSADLTFVPVPAALILGVLSLGSMGLGLKLRKLA